MRKFKYPISFLFVANIFIIAFSYAINKKSGSVEYNFDSSKYLIPTEYILSSVPNRNYRKYFVSNLIIFWFVAKPQQYRYFKVFVSVVSFPPVKLIKNIGAGGI